jgi:antitoxin ParD1/3/4
MIAFRLTRRAQADLREIWDYIAADDDQAADRVEAAIYDACLLLSKNRRIGQTRKDLTAKPVRFWPVQRFPNYIIVYGEHGKPLRVARILHGARNFSRAGL